MSDLRVDTAAIEAAYLKPSGAHERLSVSAAAPRGAAAPKVVTFAGADRGAIRVVDGVIELFQARTMKEHREAVELFEQDLLWDGPPIRVSNKGHLRLATYLSKYLAHNTIHPVSLSVTEPAPGRQLIELDAVAVVQPTRVWWVPATLLLPAEVARNVHFKIGVRGGLESGKVELFVGRLTNLPPFLAAPLRVLVGILMGAVPHALEDVLGFGFDFMDGSDYYARKRNAAFTKRHPESTNPTWDWLQDLAYDVPNWAKEQAVVAAETAQAVFGHSWSTVNETLQRIISFYVWLFNSVWAYAQQAANTVGDMLGANSGAERHPRLAPTGAQAPGGAAAAPGGGGKVYKGPVVEGRAPGLAARPVAAVGSRASD